MGDCLTRFRPGFLARKRSVQMNVSVLQRITIGVLLTLAPYHLSGDQDNNEAFNQIIVSMRDRAIDQLIRYKPNGERGIGESALIAYALMKAGVPASDAHVRRLMDQLTRQVSGAEFRPGLQNGADNYEAAFVCMAFAEADQRKYQAQIKSTAAYLIRKQNPDGAWDYSPPQQGDTSMTQVAVLGLYISAQAGVDISRRVWDKAAHWIITRQIPSGGFAYHPKPPGVDKSNETATHSMTTGALGALFLCRTQLSIKNGTSASGDRGLLRRLDRDVRPDGKDSLLVNAVQIDRAVTLGKRWLDTHFTVLNPLGHKHYYYYSLERYAAFYQIQNIGGYDWYREGVQQLRAEELKAGGWFRRVDPGGQAVHTAFALLFLVRATHQGEFASRGHRLKSGTLIAGRGLPEDLRALAVKRGKLIRPELVIKMDQLLDLIMNGKGLNVVEVDMELESDKDTMVALIRLVDSGDPLQRQQALWSLGQLGNIEAAPIMIEALADRNLSVVRQARDSLRLISRKPYGFGLKELGQVTDIRQAIVKWESWYHTVRKYDEFKED